MFDVGWSELVLIGVVALIVIGPKELPAVLRAVGQWTTKIRRMAGEFQSQFQEAMREAEMSDLKKQVAELDAAAKGIATDFDPLDLKEATKWEPKAPSASDAAAESESASLSEFASPAAAPETPNAAAPAEPVASGVPQHSSEDSAAAAPPAADAGSTAEPAAAPQAEGGGRA
jgi:sec-independent protein translocase protein TatB